MKALTIILGLLFLGIVYKIIEWQLELRYGFIKDRNIYKE